MLPINQLIFLYYQSCVFLHLYFFTSVMIFCPIDRLFDPDSEGVVTGIFDQQLLPLVTLFAHWLDKLICDPPTLKHE